MRNLTVLSYDMTKPQCPKTIFLVNQMYLQCILNIYHQEELKTRKELVPQDVTYSMWVKLYILIPSTIKFHSPYAERLVGEYMLLISWAACIGTPPDIHIS